MINVRELILSNFFEQYLLGIMSLFIIFSVIAILIILKKMNVFSHIIMRDHLTGVYNRCFFSNPEFRKVAARFPVSFIMGDIDGLKLINDTFGHKKGDKAIIKVVQILKEVCKDSKHYIIRMGGDEFLIVLPGCGEKQAECLIDRIHTLCEDGGAIDKVTLSLGSSTAGSVDDTRTLEEIIESADINMYANRRCQRLKFR